MSTETARPRGKGEQALAGDRRALTKGERQRRAILDSLVTLLATRSLGELTVGDIATHAGVRRSGFYFYFESKYSALAVATSEIWTELMDRAQFFTRIDGETAAEFLRRIAEPTVQMWRTHEAVLVASIQAIPDDDQLAQMWTTWNKRLAAILTDQVLSERDLGRAHPVSQDIPTLVSTLLSMTMHMLYLDRLNRCDPPQTRIMLDTLRDIWLASVWGSGLSA
ncbi:MAG: TetR/AcrR family transcriptional regulator [Actinomycetia bacterium]|nr:TetR/AcrR family transcriptional regulator [Actinomycetes bacterium]